MSMKIEDLQGTYEAKDISEFDTLLQKRYGPAVNSFWLSHNNENYPALSLLVSGDLSTLKYLPNDSHAGFIPAGRVKALPEGGFTTFRIDTVEQEIEIANEAVIPVSAALSAAREFFCSPQLPPSIEWIEL